MVATRRTKRGSPSKKQTQDIKETPNPKAKDVSESNSSDSDSDIDLQSLVNQTFEKMKSETMLNTTNAGFVIDKRPRRESDNADCGHTSEVHIDRCSDSDGESDSSGDDVSKRNPKAQHSLSLASSLQTSFKSPSLYVNVDAYRDPTAERIGHKKLVTEHDKEVMKKSVLTSDLEKQHSIVPYEESLNQMKKQRKKEREMTKGKNWSHMPATELTEERKNDLMVLKMRRVLDPKRFYKGNDIKGLPKYFEFGTVMDSPVDFYHSRIPKKQRKSTMVEELLADAQFRNYNKKKYSEIQEATRKSRGAFKHMKRLKKKKR